MTDRLLVLQFFPCHSPRDRFDVSLRRAHDSLLRRFAEDLPHECRYWDAVAGSTITKIVVELLIDAKVHRYVERCPTLRRFSLCGLGFLVGDLGPDRRMASALSEPTSA